MACAAELDADTVTVVRLFGDDEKRVMLLTFAFNTVSRSPRSP